MRVAVSEPGMVPEAESRGLGIVERRSVCGSSARGLWLGRAIARPAVGVRVGRPPRSGATAEEHGAEHNRQNQREIQQAKKIDSATVRHDPNRTAQFKRRQVPVRRPCDLTPLNERSIHLPDFKRPTAGSRDHSLSLIA
ncbi:MAG: hypothetical protein ACLPY3_27740 [Solirubrobacteraceae bacterium]